MQLRLTDLADMHPCLLWEDILAATVAVFADRGRAVPYEVDAAWQDLPIVGSGAAKLEISPGYVSQQNVAKVRRTYEPHRLVEIAAIAVAGLLLFRVAGSQIRDIALRGSQADYLVGELNYLLEVAGRSRRADARIAWDTRWQRLSGRGVAGFYLCVVEFETPSARLAFGS